MSKLIVSIDGVVVKEAQLTKDRSTIGRRPYNDVVVDHLSASGEHAAIQVVGGEAVLEDLGSTNGTFVNGRAIRKQALVSGDLIEIGRYKIRYLAGNTLSAPADLADPTVPPLPSTLEGLESDYASLPGEAAVPGARVRVLSGKSAGREVLLNKTVTTIGRRGYTVASITRGTHGFELAHVEGVYVPEVNGVSVADGPILLQNRDQITIGHVRLEFADR